MFSAIGMAALLSTAIMVGILMLKPKSFSTFRTNTFSLQVYEAAAYLA